MTSFAAESQRTCLYSTRYGCEHRVHICYNGPEIENTLIGHLNHYFCEKGIKTTIDSHGNTRGEEISQTTLEAIEKSTCSIIVFCENFAFSERCLDELVKILECERKGQLFRALYFRIDPSEVQNLGGSYGKAMAGHREKVEKIKVTRWEVNLYDATKLRRRTYKNGSQYKLIQEIVGEISGILNHASLYNADCLARLKSNIREPRNPLDSVSCDVDAVRKNGIGRIDAPYKVVCQSFPNTASLGRLFTCSHRKETENGEGFIMVQPSTSTSARPKQTSAEIRFLPLLDSRASQVSMPGGIEEGLISGEQMENNFDLLNDGIVKAFFAPHSTENSTLSAVQGAGSVATRTSEEVKSAMWTLRSFVSKKFHELIPEGSEFLDYIKKIVLSFDADEKIPQGMVGVLKKIISCFSHWSQDYEDANTVLETKNADLLKIDRLQKEFEAVVIESKRAVSAENEVRIQFDNLVRKKGELEEELKAVTDEIDDLISSCQAVAVRKSSLLEKGTMLKTEKNNMEVRLPRIMGDRAAARFTQEYIEAEWSKLVEVFNEILISEFGCR